MTASLPPIPQRLCEMLKEYPGHLARIHDALASVAKEPQVAPRFELAIWVLEDLVGAFFEEARQQLAVAKKEGDSELASKLEAEEALMAKLVLQKPWFGDKDFSIFFGK
ncbi:hypothetical protein QE424_003186 [Stenotrophomonas rhizophila]|uniref:Uncharacterized protein n=1 Tax=Stenotrophomonas rhizophila TaxID=216778 RepID=A0AAP5EB62_9GAMM|nr:hypothetical protein [Stenotrophomonas rhizophila]MDQ1110027.1 hypothetical protein [Stenotrophomonas rhizophila]